MTLILETCTERGLVALAKNGIIIAKEELPFGYHNAKNLLPAIDRILGPEKAEQIIVGVGPGSYTGIRMGAVAAKTFAFAWQIPIFTISTLEAFTEPDAAVILDAKMSGAYLLLPGGKPIVCPLPDLPKALGSIKTLVTPNAGRLRQKISDTSYQWREKAPDPVVMLCAAATHPPLRHDQMELLYLRQTQAELESKQPNVVNQ